MANTAAIFKGSFAKILAKAGINLETINQWVRYSNNSQTLDIKAPTLAGSYSITYPDTGPAAGNMMEFTAAGLASFVPKPAGITATYTGVFSSDPAGNVAHGLGGYPDLILMGYEEQASSNTYRPQLAANHMRYNVTNLVLDLSDLAPSPTNRVRITALRF